MGRGIQPRIKTRGIAAPGYARPTLSDSFIYRLIPAEWQQNIKISTMFETVAIGLFSTAHDMNVRIISQGVLTMPRIQSKRNVSLMDEQHVLSDMQLAKFMEVIEENMRLRKLQLGIFRWMLRLAQGYISMKDLKSKLGGKLQEADIVKFYEHALYKPKHYRNKALTIIFRLLGCSKHMIADFLNISPRTVSKYVCRFERLGTDTFLHWGSYKYKKVDKQEYTNAIFAILHAPPSSYGINRASWTIENIRQVMSEQGMCIGHNGIGQIIHNAGYCFRKSKTVLTSTDPGYREKLKKINAILSKLKTTEKFFSIDEYGPFSIKAKGGRSFVPKGEPRIVPQWQLSKGYLIITGALELSTNQVTHFFSKKKNTDEMIKLLRRLLKQYAGQDCIYLSWDCASWHISHKLQNVVEEINDKDYRRTHGTPMVKLTPLPACAQFLNVIESVFSGMATAIIHNSDYNSVKECKQAITRYFEERNRHFQKYPKRAGNKIWGDELVPPRFSEANNCKPKRWAIPIRKCLSKKIK
jgi:transposase